MVKKKGLSAPGKQFDTLEEHLIWDELNKGVVRFNDSITEYTVAELLQRMDYIASTKSKKMTMHLTSPGGEVYPSFAVYDKVLEIRKKGITTECIVHGFAASAASMIFLQAFDNRLATANSRLHLHEPSRWVFFSNEKTSEMKDEFKEMTAITSMIFEILAKRCKKKIAEITRAVERREKWMSAVEAKKFGLIDSIV